MNDANADQTSRATRRVAIIGGGCAGLATAYQLTRPELRGQYDVTVYQYGHRLGGKGASGRGRGDRIEEHGIHVWMGCYENAFRMMRDVYEQCERAGLAGRKRTWRDAFTPLPQVGLAHWEPAVGWEVWSTYFPPLPGVPGDPLVASGDVPGPFGSASNPFSVAGYLERILVGLSGLLEATYFSGGQRRPPPSSDAEQWAQVQRPTDRLARIVAGGLRSLASPVSTLLALETLLSTRAVAGREPMWLESLTLVGRAIREALGGSDTADRDVQRGAEVADLMLASARGVISHGLLVDPRGFDAIDDWDFRDWLARHGAAATSVNSAFVRGLYNLMFAYRGGDHRRPALSAAVGLRVCVRMFFTYRESLYYRMRAGMGDIVFTPLYLALRERGVKFEFFHRLERLRLGQSPSNPPHVEALEFAVQAKVRDDEAYDPLVDVRGLGCWPSEPRWEQLVDAKGAALRDTLGDANFEMNHERRHVARKTLRVGHDFDLVVVAVGMGELSHSCSELPARIPRFARMLEHVETVATQALQVWARPTMAQLGWTRGTVMLTGFHHPFDSWTDMTPLLPEESFDDAGLASGLPQALAYFCNVLPAGPEPDGSEAQAEAAEMAVRQNSIEFLDRQIGHLWPNAVDDAGHFRWDQLVATGAMPGRSVGSGPDAIDGQYYRANVNPSDRYILSLPGSSQHRISPLEVHVRNMTIAGDWTHCGINVGCIEAAVMSGKLAARALTGTLPAFEEIVGYDHP